MSNNNTEKSISAIETMCNSIVSYFKRESKTLKYDVTYDGSVTQNLGGGLYVVRVSGGEYSVKSETGRTNLTIRTIVKVVAPQNDFDRLFIY